MHGIYLYSAVDSRRKQIKCYVDISKVQELEKEGDIDIMIRGVVVEALKSFTKHKNISNLHIQITQFNKVNADLNYQIQEEANPSIHHISFRQFQQNKIQSGKPKGQDPLIDDIVASQVVPLRSDEIGSISLLERFTKFKKTPIHFPDKAKNILAAFFAKILAQFQFLEKIWFAMTDKTAKDIDPTHRRLKWDFNLLSEICGTLPSDGMSMAQALQYMSQTLERENQQVQVSDPAIKTKLRQAADFALKIVSVRNHYSASNAQALMKKIEKEVLTLDTTRELLVPVGYFHDNKLVEALVEISKESSGKYRIVLISTDEKTRDLFDREAGVQTTSQSIRREISNVDEKELLIALPTLIELQTTPVCLRNDGPTWQTLFLQTLRFDQSQVEVSQTTDSFRKAESQGRLSEVITYVKGEYTTFEESSIFDLAVRLRLFLDICQRNKKGFKDPSFWKSVRTTALHLAALIEKEKSIVGSQAMQGVELTHIYGELKALLDKLGESPPELVDLQAKLHPLAIGTIETEVPPSTPSLYPLKVKPNVFAKDPPFDKLDLHHPVQSISQWGRRCRTLISSGNIQEAANEAKLMTRMLPNISDDFWRSLGKEQTDAILTSFNEMGEAIARGSAVKNSTSIHDITSLTILNYYIFSIILNNNAAGDREFLKPFFISINKIFTELKQCNLTKTDLNTLEQLNNYFDSKNHIKWDKQPTNQSPIKSHSRQTLLNLNQFMAVALGIGGSLSGEVNNNQPLKFTLARDPSIAHLQGNQSWRCDMRLQYGTPLALRAPSYAFDVSREITNRYATEFCCLGCIRDNCPNYNNTPKEQQRVHPLYMIHNFVDIYCQHLTKKETLHRDELTDLLYTQQLNQNAQQIFDTVHGRTDGFDVASGFNEEDRCCQLINTMMAYLEHPHFFKHPDLRWLFENKIFNHQIFTKMLVSEEYRPFLSSMLTKLKKEISLAYASNDKEMAAYLLWVSREMREKITDPSLLALLPKEEDKTLCQLAKAMIEQTDELLLSGQMMVFPILLQMYYKIFIKNSNDACFDSSGDLELILCAAARIESNEKLKRLVDPEIYDSCRAITSFALVKCQQTLAKETLETQGNFINKLLFRLNPSVSSLRLKWNASDFPTFIAKDEQGKTYQFDLATGKMAFESRSQDEIPDNIKHHPVVERLFGTTLNENWNILGTSPTSLEPIIAYTHHKFPNFRIVARKNKKKDAAQSQIIIERKIAKQDGEQAWVTYAKFDTQECFKRNQAIPEQPDLPIAAAIAIGDRTCWIDKEKKHIYVFEQDSDQLYAVMTLSTSVLTKKTTVSDVHLLKQDVHLLSVKPQDLEKYSSIEDPRFIEVLGKNNRPKVINYTRYEMSATGAPLSYDIGPKGTTCKAFPNYLLSANGVRPGSADPAFGVTPLPLTFDNYHLLQKDGDEKVLIPRLGLKQTFAATGIPLPMSNMVFSEKFEKNRIYEFSVDKETNRLTTKSGDAYAYLAYVCLAHQDYESSTYYLSKARTTAGYGEDYEKVFDWSQQWTDNTPNGRAMQLRFLLFQENVLEDTQIRQIREGVFKKGSGVDIIRIPRLIEITKLYEKYKILKEVRSASESGLEPTLDLSQEEEQQVHKLIQALLAEHGNQPVESEELTPIRAHEIPLQFFSTTHEASYFGINNSTFFLWASNGRDRDQTRFTVKNPLWISQNFQNLFNQIISNKVDSVHYVQLKHQIRMIGELPKHKLNAVQKKNVEMAQSYLLKLMTAKEKQPHEFQDVINQLGQKNRLKSIEGPLFNFSRTSALDRMLHFLEGAESHTFELSSSTKTFAERLILKIEHLNEEKWRQGFFKGLFTNVDPFNLQPLAKKMLKFVEGWENQANAPPFKEALQTFIFKEIFGSSGVRGIHSLDLLLKTLDSVDIVQVQQTMVQKPLQPPKPTATFNERFSKLLEKSESHSSIIEALEKEVADRPDADAPKLIETKPEHIHGVMDDDTVRSYVSAYFTVTPSPSPNINQRLFDDLSQAKEKSYARVAEKHRADLNAHLAIQKNSGAINRGNAEILKKNLEEEKAKTIKEEETLRKNLLQYVERFSTPAGILAMRRLVGQGVKPSLDFLIALWRRGETDKDWEQHPLKKLGMNEIPRSLLKQLDNDIAKYLVLSTTHNHLNRVIDTANHYLSSCKEENPLSFGDRQLANELFESVQTTRNYSLQQNEQDPDYRDLLYVEYTQKIILYADQIQTLREMVQDPNAVRQLRMGRGKTEVIMPILAKKKATGKNLVMLMFPEELYETNCRGLDSKNRLLFGQEMHRFEFSRKTAMNVEAIEKIYLNMLKTIRDKGFMMTTKRSILSLKDSYIFLLNKLTELKPSEDKTELIGQIRALSKVISLVHNTGEALADEVDNCLDIRKEVNFAIGETEAVDKIKGDIAEELLHLLLDQKPTESLYEFKEALLQNTQASISPEKRTSILKQLVDFYYDKHQEKLADFDKKSFVNYIMDDPSQISMRDKVLALKKTDNDLFKQISSLKALINQGFGMTFGKVGNVNYGRDPLSTNTIPYKASDTPSIGSEYDDDIERICFTYQDYLQNGVTYKQVYQIVAQMQKSALIEMRNLAAEDSSEFMNILDMKAAKDFQEFVQKIDPEKKLPASINLASMCNPKMIEVLVEVLNTSPKSLLSFCHLQVVGKMQQYTAQINAVSSETPELFLNFGGFTGTPWNIHTYHDKINAQASVGVDGFTWALMLGRDVPVKTFKFDAKRPIDSLLANTDFVSKFQGCVDTGAYLRGTSKVDFIDKVFEIAHKKNIDVAAGIYFDEAGKIVKKQSADERALPIEIAPVTDLMKNVTFYDQAHTTGTDIKQGKKAQGLVTIGENTFIRDLFQGGWRFRQWHLEQSIVLAVSEAIQNRILEGQNRDLTPSESRQFCEEICKFCLMNETRREVEDNFKAEKEMIQSFSKRKLLPAIAQVINEGASDENIIQMATRFASTDGGIFIKKRPKEEAYDDYAQLKTMEPPAEAFKRLRDKEAEKSMAIADFFGKLDLPKIQKKFEEYGQTIAGRKAPPADWFLNEVDTNQSVGGEVEQEAQAEVEQELELMIETETQTQVEIVKEISIPVLPTGEAGHGDVHPLTTKDLYYLAAHPEYLDDDTCRHLARHLPFFDINLISSAVFERNMPKNASGSVAPQSVFYSNRKPVKYVLITKNSAGGWSMIIPTIHEAHMACRDFVKKAKNVESVLVGISAGQPLMVYKTGEDRTAALPFTLDKDREIFYKLYVQAKLFNGEIEFTTKEEQEALKAWLLSKGSDEFKRYFERNILPAKPKRFADNYPKSTLYKIFQELSGQIKISGENIETVSVSVVTIDPSKAPKEAPPPQSVQPPVQSIAPVQVPSVSSIAMLNFTLMQLVQNNKKSIQDKNSLITSMLKENQEAIKQSLLKDRLTFIEIIKNFHLLIEENGYDDKDLVKTELIKLAGRCISNAKDWATDITAFNRIDNAIASAAILDLLNQNVALENFDLEAWPLVGEWLKKS